MTTKTETVAPDGKPFALPLRQRATGKRWRLLYGPVPNMSRLGTSAYVLASRTGVVITMSAKDFEAVMEYVPGGQ